MNLEQFIEKVYEIGKDKYPTEMLTKFIEYWTETNTNGRKMKWEYEKTFNIPGRLAYMCRRFGYQKTDLSHKTTQNDIKTDKTSDLESKKAPSRKEILLKGLQMCCQAFNKPISEALSKSEAYEHTLGEIPDKWLIDSFKQAIKTNTFWPNPKKILEAYKEVDFGPVNKAPQLETGKPYLTTIDTDCIKRVRKHSPLVVDYLMECGLEQTPHLPLEPAQARLFSKAFARKYGVRV